MVVNLKVIVSYNLAVYLNILPHSKNLNVRKKPCCSQLLFVPPFVGIYKCISKAERDFLFAIGFKKIEIF